MVPNSDRSTVKHARQNIENDDCHQWLSRSFAPYGTLYLLLKTRSFFSVASAVIMFFSLGQTDGHRYHDNTLHVPKTSWWIENCTKFCKFIFGKIIKIVATAVKL